MKRTTVNFTLFHTTECAKYALFHYSRAALLVLQLLQFYWVSSYNVPRNGLSGLNDHYS